MKTKRIHLIHPAWQSVAWIGGLSLLLAGCSSGNPGNEAQPAVAVQTAMPKMKVFHAGVTAFGQLAAGTRNAMTLSLPQAGQIIAIPAVAGQRVRRGDALLELETDPATHSAWLQAQSALKVARGDLARTEHLHAEKLATNAQLDSARKAMADAQAALDAQAKLGGARTMATVHAPAAGTVTALDASRGQRVAAGAALIQFAPASALDAQLGIDPGDIALVRTGMRVALKPVYATHEVHTLHGTVALVGDAVNPQTHQVDVITNLDAQADLPAGTALSATIATTPFKAWAVPRNALQSDAQGNYVYQIEHGKAKRVDVKVLAPDGSPVGVEGALDAEAPVITLGSYEVSDGDPVRASPPTMTASHGTATR